jgi:hypothetical protein
MIKILVGVLKVLGCYDRLFVTYHCIIPERSIYLFGLPADSPYPNSLLLNDGSIWDDLGNNEPIFSILNVAKFPFWIEPYQCQWLILWI